MNIRGEFGQCVEHHVDGSITSTFAKYSANEADPGMTCSVDASIDLGLPKPRT